MGGVEKSRNWRVAEILHHDYIAIDDFTAEDRDSMPALLRAEQFEVCGAGRGVKYLKPAPNDCCNGGWSRSGLMAQRRMRTIRRWLIR
jgi:hypothetical protein